MRTLDAARRESVALPTLLVVAGFAAAVVAQGGYYLPGRLLSGLLVALGVVLARPRPNLLVVAGGAFAAWALVRGLLEGDVVKALPAIAAIGVFTGAVVVVAQADRAQREVLAAAVVGTTALVALTGWVAVVFRVPSWSTVAEGLVRAGSTLTYPNAAAAIMAVGVAVALALPQTLFTRLASFLLCLGIGATMSRAGVIALVAGLLVLVFGQGFRRTVVAAVPPLAGGLVAFGALLPSVRVAEEPRPLVAFGGLVVGAVVTLVLPRLGRIVAMLLAGGSGFAVWWFADGPATRLTVSSPDRSGAIEAALKQVARTPLLGTGPGKSFLFFQDRNTGMRFIQYVHNEYLQVLVELGAIGLLLVLAVVAAVLIGMRRGDPLWAGAMAAVVVVLVHSAFDFLWHLPAVLVVAGLCAGLGYSSEKDTDEGMG